MLNSVQAAAFTSSGRTSSKSTQSHKQQCNPKYPYQVLVIMHKGINFITGACPGNLNTIVKRLYTNHHLGG